nr:hypothetical protein [Tanacetum cinerariifolium]
MADENAPAPAPTRSNDQILPFSTWVPIGKSNFVLDLQRKQKNPIFQIYITPIDQAHQFVSPPSGDAIMDFVNEMGYPKVIHFVSRMAVNILYHPWRAILSMINQCLTCKTSREEFIIITRDQHLCFILLKKISDLEGKMKPTTAKQPKLKPVKEKSSKPAPALKPKMSLESCQAQSQAHVGSVAIQEPIAEATRPLLVVEGKADEHVIFEEPLSSSGTLSLTKNFNDAYTIRDPIINDKSTEDEPGELNVDSKVVSMVTVPIHQASFLVPPLSTPNIDLSPPKPVSSTTQAPISTTTTMTTTTTHLLPPPPPQQSTSDSELAACATTLEQKLVAIEQKSKTLDNITQNLGSSVFMSFGICLTRSIKPLKTYVRYGYAFLKEIVLRRADYKEYKISEADFKNSHPNDFEDLDEFLAKKDKSRKRRPDNQDPPPPPLDSDPSKKRRHDSDNVNISYSEDTDTAHLPKLKTRQDWMKLTRLDEPVLEEDKAANPKPDWVIPLNELSERENNWANALASSYQDPDEEKLLRQTGDMSSFINWFCKWIGKKKLIKTDLEGPAFKVVRPFHDNSISLQF